MTDRDNRAAKLPVYKIGMDNLSIVSAYRTAVILAAFSQADPWDGEAPRRVDQADHEPVLSALWGRWVAAYRHLRTKATWRKRARAGREAPRRMVEADANVTTSGSLLESSSGAVADCGTLASHFAFCVTADPETSRGAPPSKAERSG